MIPMFGAWVGGFAQDPNTSGSILQKWLQTISTSERTCKKQRGRQNSERGEPLQSHTQWFSSRTMRLQSKGVVTWKKMHLYTHISINDEKQQMTFLYCQNEQTPNFLVWKYRLKHLIPQKPSWPRSFLSPSNPPNPPANLGMGWLWCYHRQVY